MSPLIHLERAAQRARQALSKLEHESTLAREKGELLPPAFWEVFGAATVSVRLAEREVTKAREMASK